MSRAPLLIELGCEEIPARMIPRAAADLAEAVAGLVDAAGLARGDATAWGGTRRLAVRVDAVEGRQPDRVEDLTGPPAAVAFDAAGKPTPAALGFAKKQGIDPADLKPVETPRGTYAGVRREVAGRTLGALLAEGLPGAVAGMRFPKTMRWGDGGPRWVRPLHWIVALHGDAVLDLEVFGVRAGDVSRGHRFLAAGEARVADADAYAEALRGARVLVDPAERRRALRRLLDDAAVAAGGTRVEDEGLLEEVADLVEWPGVVCGAFDEAYLDLPRELLVTTLRHHQKCFCVQGADGALVPRFLAVANTDRDPAGHIRRGNEWVVGGRLEDAKFFWSEDRRSPLESRVERLAGVTVHAKLGSYLDKAERIAALAAALGERLGWDASRREAARTAARLAKADLVTGTVGEFPELQGRVGGLLLRAEGAPAEVADAVYHHYRPLGPGDEPAPAGVPAAVALADKLDAVGTFVSRVERPTGSRDPFGLRRAVNGIFRTVAERELPLSLADVAELAGGGAEVAGFLGERLPHFLRERGFRAGEIAAALRPDPGHPSWGRPLGDLLARLEALQGVRDRRDFRHLVELTKRVDNILVRNADTLAGLDADAAAGFEETEGAARDLRAQLDAAGPRIERSSEARDYPRVVEELAGLIGPVDRFFADVLVMDPERPAATAARTGLLGRLRDVVTADFDIRELSGEAERSEG